MKERELHDDGTPPAESAADSPLHQGLRERKKQLMRELISDTATLMFLERGYDAVKVSDIAAACDVSEKTIYNYFPTKESLILDREEESARELRRAFGPEGTANSPVEAMLDVLEHELENFLFYMNAAEHVTFSQVADFNDLIDSTPALKAARAEMIERLAQIAAHAMAERAGVDPEDPEPQIAADALTSLWRIFYRAVVKYSVEDLTSDELRRAVMSDVQRAAHLLDAGLWSFGAARAGVKSPELNAASDASVEARKEVIAALKQARVAWMAMKSEMDGRGHGDRATDFFDPHDAHRAAFEIRRQARRRAQELRDEARLRRDEGRSRGADTRDDARRRREEARRFAQDQREQAKSRRDEARRFGEILKQEIKQELKNEARQRGQEIKDAVRGRGAHRPPR